VLPDWGELREGEEREVRLSTRARPDPVVPR
jgi:hypothetical protein